MYYYKDKWQSNKCPFKYKSDLVEWCKETYPNEPITKFKKMKINQLKAIWYNYEKKI